MFNTIPVPKFNIDGIEFTLQFDYNILILDDSSNYYGITVAYAKLENPLQIVAAKSVKHPKDLYKQGYGEKVAAHRLFNAIYGLRAYKDATTPISRKEFVSKCFSYLFENEILRK